MDMTGHYDDYFGKYYERCLRRARVAGYVLLAGLFVEVANGIIWFHGIESVASVIAVGLMLGGASGEIFFEYRAKLADKGTPTSALRQFSTVQQSELSFSKSSRGFSRRGVARQLRSRRTPALSKYVAFAEQLIPGSSIPSQPFNPA